MACSIDIICTIVRLDDDDEEDDDEEDEITKKDVESNDGDIDSAKDITDAMIRRFDEHEDSVYGLAWAYVMHGYSLLYLMMPSCCKPCT